VNLEIVLGRESRRQIAQGTGIERHGHATSGADEVVAMHRGGGDIDGAPSSIEDARQDAE